MRKSQAPAFVVDCSLGRLAKQLRLAGFDTLLDHQTPDGQHLLALAGDQRIVLTRSTSVRKSLSAIPIIFICHNEPLMQVRQVISELNLQRTDLRPFSRCGNCNQALQTIAKDDVFGRVPEYVWQQHPAFKTCTRCNRVYWPGSHAQRWLERMTDWFK